MLVASGSVRFYIPAYACVKGWVALRLDVGTIDWKDVFELAVNSYRLIAPKRLARKSDVREHSKCLEAETNEIHSKWGNHEF